MKSLSEIFGLNKQTPTPTPNVPQPDGKAHIYNLIIIDESGSMGHLREATLSGVNETINTMREAQRQFGENQTQYLTLVTFDSPGTDGIAVRTLIDQQPISEVADFKDYQPCGCTPLYDAMGQSITRLQQTVKADPDASAVVTVVTDGLENASHEYSGRMLQKLIEQLKAEGWNFSYMGSAHDVKSVTDLLSIDNVMEFRHDEQGTRCSWDYERSAKMRRYRRMSLDWDSIKDQDVSQKHSHFCAMNQDYYSDRVTPGRVSQLTSGQVFVFGSNPLGHHSGGSARVARERFGAIEGQSSGLQGQSYAITTTGGMQLLVEQVKAFIDFAEQHQELSFLVTEIGCGNAGYAPAQIAPLFSRCVRLENVSLPFSFWSELGIDVRTVF